MKVDASAAKTAEVTVPKATVVENTAEKTVVKVDPVQTVAPKVATPSKAVEAKKEAPVVTPAVAKAEEKAVVTPAVATVAPTVTAETQAPAAAATTQVASSNKGAAIYQAALAQLGTFQDCTLLVTNALKAVGINFHDWPAGYMSLGTVIPASQAQPGDLVYYANGGTGLAHIGVYAGNGQAVHGGWLGNQTVLNTANLGSGPVYIRVK